MKNILNILILCLSVFISSCHDFLNVNPKAEVINEDMFSNRQGCEDAINGIYGRLKDVAIYGEYYNWGIFDLLSQDLRVGKEVQPQYNLTKYDYKGASDILVAMWKYPYEIIGYTNNAIENLETKDANEIPLLNIYKGELYALRAMLHFDILKCFAKHIENGKNEQGIPYTTSYSFKHTPFSNVGEVYEKIISDLKYAQKLLETDRDNISWPRKDVADIDANFMKYRQLHLNYYAATAILARVLRMKGDYREAGLEAMKVIDSKKFPLAQKDEILQLVAGVLSEKETIFGIYSTEYIKTTKKRLYDGASWTSYFPYQSISGGQFLFNYENVFSKDLGGNSGMDARLNWLRAVEDGGNEKRLLKNVDVTLIKNSNDTPEKRGLIDGISILRIPEMYYIVVEAFIRESKFDEASKYLNEVLLSRGLTKLEDRNPVLQVSLELLYNERYKEFYGEGQRWFDMKKMNMDIESNEEMKVVQASDDVYVFPIPKEEFEYRIKK